MQKKIEFRRGALTIRGHIYGSTEACSHAVILCHGFLANERMCRKYAQLLADMGFLALKPPTSEEMGFQTERISISAYLLAFLSL